MSKRVFFSRECPTCGRRLLILVEYLGKKVVCPHCGARIDAVELSMDEPASGNTNHSLMQRVDELLETQAVQKASESRLVRPR